LLCRHLRTDFGTCRTGIASQHQPWFKRVNQPERLALGREPQTSEQLVSAAGRKKTAKRHRCIIRKEKERGR